MKKSIIVFGIPLLIGICLGGIGFVLFSQRQDDKYIKTANEDDISRYEWMEMLCEQSGLTEYQNEEPYYEDVNTNNSYFPYIQSAVEWDVLEEEKKFDGEGYASGRFVLITAMKSLGEKKLKLYLDTEESITDTVYVQTALEHNLLKKEELSRGISRESAERVLEQIANLKYTEFWVDDYEEVVYQDGVVEIAAEDILEKKEDGLEITVSEAILSDISEGTIIVYPPDKTGLKAAKRISKVEAGGKLTLADNVKQEEVLESFVVSDIVELTAQDIFNYYGMQAEYSADNMAYRQGSMETMMPVWDASKEITDKGFKIEVSVEEGKNGEKNYLEIKITDNNKNEAFTLPLRQNVSWDSGYQIELDVSQIYAAAHVEFEPILDLKYAEAALDIQSTFSGKIKAENSKESARVMLFETPVPLGSGICGVDVLVYLVVSVEGEIYLEAELPANFCVKYDEKGGIRRDRSEQKEKKVELNVDCEADFMLRVEPVLTCLFGDVMDMELDFGLALEFEENMRPTGMVCLDLSAAFPVIKVSVCGDDKKDTWVGDKGVSVEWELLSGEDALFHKNAHVEIADGASEIVSECTYGETKKESSAGGQGNTYYTRYGEVNQIDSPVFCFDYPDNWNISIEEVNATPIEYEIFGDYVQKVVELSNKRSVTVTFMQIDDEIYELAGRNRFYTDYSVEKIADMDFAISDGSSISSFVVVKLTDGGTIMTGIGDWDEGGAVSYAIMRESIVDESEGTLLASGPLGFYEMISFHYPDSYAFFAYAPDGQFTEEEENEVIAILQSFREVP